MFFIVYAFKGHVHAFAGRVKVASHSSCRTSAIFKYFCPLSFMLKFYLLDILKKRTKCMCSPDQRNCEAWCSMLNTVVYTKNL